MKTSYKAALLSALVAPGAGHYFLKSYIKAAVFFTCTAIAVYLIMKHVVERANTIVDQIVSGSAPADVLSVYKLVHESNASEAATSLVAYFPTLFFILWLIAVLDAFRLGRAQEKQDQSLP